MTGGTNKRMKDLVDVSNTPWILEVTQEGNWVVDKELYEESLGELLNEKKKAQLWSLAFILLALTSSVTALYTTYL